MIPRKKITPNRWSFGLRQFIQGWLRTSARPKTSTPRLRWGRYSRLRLILLLCLVLFPIAAWLALPLVPLPVALVGAAGAEEANATSLEILDRNGQTLRESPDDQSYISKRVSFGEIPQSLIDATLAAEDKRFWKHHGIDWRGAARAAIGFIRHRRVVSGGSTITQQLIKIAEPRPRTFRTKVIEALQALRLEQLWSKQRILVEYLNRLDYGNLHAGCAAAAKFYFQKPLHDLSVAESAFLAALPQAPTRLNPHRHFERAKARQQWTLRRMIQDGSLSKAEFARAAVETLKLAVPRRVFQAPHFVDLILQSITSVGKAETGGRIEARPVILTRTATVHTTLDLALNQLVEKILKEQIGRLHPQHALEGALVVIENDSGNVLALIGSEDYFAPANGQVNGAWAARSAGSTLKPFTYLLAFEQGANPASLVADVPVEFSTPTGIFRPVNYNHRCYGPMRYRLALANSLNISAVKVLASIGGPAVLKQSLEECGLTTLNQSSEFYGLGLTIGNAETRLLELANAYACLANLGTYKPYRLFASSSSTLTAPPKLRGRRGMDGPMARRVFDPAAAYLIADILSDNGARALAFGLDSDLRLAFPVACKTGTSSDFRDNWAFGYTPEFTVGVWVGNFDGSPMEHISGVTGATPILHEIFVQLHQLYGTSWYARPDNVVKRSIDRITGKLVSDRRPDSVLENFVVGHFPLAWSGQEVDPAGRVRLPAEYREWFNSGENSLAGLAVVEEESSSATLSLVSPLPGTTYFLDPDLPPSSRWLSLKARGPRALAWESDSLQCQSGPAGTFAILVEGRHHLRVRNPLTGAVAETWILVKGL